MATLNFQSTNRPEPLLISIKRVGDTRERFISRNAAVVSFDEDSGTEIPYVMTITDSTSKVSTKEFTLSCERPPDCDYGPVIEEIISFNAQSITYRFNGVNVAQIERNILSNDVIVDSVIDIPSMGIVTSNFSGSLSNGQYALQLRGKSCYSESPSTMGFIITDGATSLAWWPNYPRFDYDSASDTYRILLAVDRTGDGYAYQIKNTDTDTIIVEGFSNFVRGEAFVVTGFDPGNYHVEVASVSADFEIDAPPEDCDVGPELLSVTSLSSTQTRFVFDGLNVFVIEWFIRTPSDTIEYSDTIEPGGVTVTINHPALSGGTHNLLIKGSSCTSQAGIVDNLDFVVDSPTLSITSVGVTQQSDGRYKLDVAFVGGSPNYTITVRGLSNNVIGTFPNTTGSPASVMLPGGIAPQTVKVAVMDVNNAVDEETAVILPAPVPKMNFLQADNFFSLPTRTPMTTDGGTYFIGNPSDYNWDIEFVLPNGGQWDYIEKRFKKYVSGTPQDRNLQTITSQPANYSVGPTSGAERMFLPRTGTQVTIDGQNAFKTANKYEITFIARKGGVGGTIVAQMTRTFTVSAPATLSGITLYNRNGATLGSAIAELNTVGDSKAKPTPHYDFAITGFGGITFTKIFAIYRLKQNNTYVEKFSNLLDFGTPKTSVTASEFSLFKFTQDVGTAVQIFSQENQTWQIEFVAYNGSTVVASKAAIFDFTVNVSSSFINQGFIRKQVAGRSYQINPGLDFGATLITPSGNLKLYHPTSRQSLNGQSTCYPWIYFNHVRMTPDDLTAFRGSSGLAFGTGKHTFSIKWHSNAVANYDDVIDGGAAGNAYNLAGENLSVSGSYSQMDDYFTVTIIQD